MIEARPVAEIGGERLGGRRRRPERAKPIERPQRRHCFDIRLARRAGSRARCVAGSIDDPSQHLDEGAGHRQIGPAHVGTDVEQSHQSLAAAFAGDERRAVFQRRPALCRQYRVGLGQHLPVDGNVLGHREPGERSVGGEGCEVLRLFPGQAAAEAASAAAQFHRDQIIVGLRQPRSGKAHQHAAAFDPGIDTFANFRRQGADIGEHDHRQLLIEKLRDRLLRRAAIAKPDIGKRRQSPGEIEGRRQQRLRGIAA